MSQASVLIFVCLHKCPVQVNWINREVSCSSWKQKYPKEHSWPIYLEIFPNKIARDNIWLQFKDRISLNVFLF